MTRAAVVLLLLSAASAADTHNFVTELTKSELDTSAFGMTESELQNMIKQDQEEDENEDEDEDEDDEEEDDDKTPSKSSLTEVKKETTPPPSNSTFVGRNKNGLFNNHKKFV